MNVIRDNFERGGDERNVSSGFHAIEFLLWGQDLNEDGSAGAPRDASPGQRPVSDYSVTPGECTSGANPAIDEICMRRGRYLLAAAELLVYDLKRVRDAWNPNGADNHYASFVAGGDESLALILEGMGRLGIRRTGGRAHEHRPVDRQSGGRAFLLLGQHPPRYLPQCQGIDNSFMGDYRGVDGDEHSGAGIDDLLTAEALPDLANEMRAAIEDTMAKVGVIDRIARSGTPFDNQIQMGINEPNVSGAIRALSAQTQVLERVIAGLNVTTGDLRQDTEEDI